MIDPAARYRPYAALIGAGLCVAAFWVAGEAAGWYTVLYGRHGWGPPETAFLLNFLLLGLPSAFLLTVALSGWVGDRFTAVFERLTTVSPGRTRLCAGLVALVVGALVVLARYDNARLLTLLPGRSAYRMKMEKGALTLSPLR